MDNVQHSPNKLNSKEALREISGMPGVDPSKNVGHTFIDNEQIKEIAEECSVPNDALSSDQRHAIEEYQMRLGVGIKRNQQRTSTRFYSYAR